MVCQFVILRLLPPPPSRLFPASDVLQVDGKTVFTSDEALDLAFVPEYVAIVGSGYIGLEFSDVYTALGAEVTFIEVSTPRYRSIASNFHTVMDPSCGGRML